MPVYCQTEALVSKAPRTADNFRHSKLNGWQGSKLCMQCCAILLWGKLLANATRSNAILQHSQRGRACKIAVAALAKQRQYKSWPQWKWPLTKQQATFLCVCFPIGRPMQCAATAAHCVDIAILRHFI